MLADGRRLTLITALLAAPGALFGQAHHPLDSAQVAQARALCGPLDDDSILQHPLSPLRPGAVVSNRVKELEQPRSEEHTSELQSLRHLVCRLLLEKKKDNETKHA